MFLSPHISKDKLNKLCISSIPLESLKDLSDFPSALNSPYSASRLSKSFSEFNLQNFETHEEEEEDENYNILTTVQFSIIIIILQLIPITLGLNFSDNYSQFEKMILEIGKLNLIVITLILILVFHLFVVFLSLLIEKINFKLIINLNLALIVLSAFVNSFNLPIKEFFLIFLAIEILAGFLIFLIMLIIALNWVDFGCLSTWLGCTLTGSSLISYLIQICLNLLKSHSSWNWSQRALTLIFCVFIGIFNWNFNQKIDFIMLQEDFKLNWNLILNLEFFTWFLQSFFASILNSSIAYLLSSNSNIVKLTKTQSWILLVLNLTGWCLGSSLIGIFAGRFKLKSFSIILTLAVSLIGFLIWFTQLNYYLALAYSLIFHFLVAGYLPTLVLGLNETLQLQTKAVTMRGLILTTILLNHLIPNLLILILTHNIKMTGTLNSYLILISSSASLIVCLGALLIFGYLKRVKIQN
ncbi:hypothetical protein CONCODRAFT_2568 [Conidiobolus coronatus NRRL 28638]|uniref:MFS general substrate transporter n=1 Tax=Conidiobolus coronatus (strain ATCC 28846 / CBS 209.66 / NRRL 28638) TaxID=796925 RepID=A0A137PH81_CONC2|nr:hypothetical protein CONCODRAFT_2568 [Conidiobolus coronatus NRRL 28638]|eukprot:KXN74364.1 hypothetical protein CONCODRAFT_2568 [Conidiobolus coronatus NRRL 28638]